MIIFLGLIAYFVTGFVLYWVIINPLAAVAFGRRGIYAKVDGQDIFLASVFWPLALLFAAYYVTKTLWKAHVGWSFSFLYRLSSRLFRFYKKLLTGEERDHGE